MKFKLGCYNVEVKARFNIGKLEDNTMGLLNEISIVYHLAAERERMRGATASANAYEARSNEIYNALNAAGHYDAIRKSMKGKEN